MTVQPNTLTPEAVLQKIDAIANDLQLLRQIVQTLMIDWPEESAPIIGLPSVLDIVQASPGHRVFRNASEVNRYLQEERATWDS